MPWIARGQASSPLVAPWRFFSTKDEGTEKPEAEAAATEGEADEKAEGTEAEAEAEAAPEPDARDAQIATLEVELKSAKETALRALADAENARTIARRDVDNAKQFAVSGFAKGLLDVADNLSLAVASVPEEVGRCRPSCPHVRGSFSCTYIFWPLARIWPRRGMSN